MFLALYTLICGIILISIGAEFLGYMMIIIYVGAVIILFLFVVMMLEINKEETEDTMAIYIKKPKLVWGAFSFIILLNTVFYDIFEKKSTLLNITTKNWEYIITYHDNIKAFETLYTDNFLYLLVSGSLLLVALTAAIALTNNNTKTKEQESYIKI
jgi:NADH-quinone oxidoreductase subunit J